MHRNMTIANYGSPDENKFHLFYMYNSLLTEERTETLIYDFVGNTNILSFLDLIAETFINIENATIYLARTLLFKYLL